VIKEVEEQNEQGAPGNGFQVAPPAAEDEVSIRQIFELLRSAKWTIIGITVAALALGAIYLLRTAPTYQADGLIQVEDESKGGAASTLTDLSSLLMGGTVQTEAEIQILQSRMVLDEVVDKMNMLVSVSARRFPVIGSAVARLNQNRLAPLSAPLGLKSFAWGGERITVATFEVPESELNQQFTITATAQGFELFDVDDTKILAGKVGETATAHTSDGDVTIFIRELSARPGTQFYVLRRSPLDAWKGLLSAITITEKGKQSGVVQVTFRGGSPRMVADVINNLEDSYLRQNVERRSAEAEQSLEFLQKQLPDMKAKVEAAQANLNEYQARHGTVDVTQETEQILQQGVALESRRMELLENRQEALQRFTPEHPVIRAIDQQLQLIQEADDKIKKDSQKLPATQQDVFSLMRDLGVQTELYTSMLDTIQQLHVAKAGTIGNVRIVDRAVRPTRPASPDSKIVMFVALVAGLFVGCVVVVLQRALLRGVDDPMELERIFGLMTFGAIPYSNAQKRLGRLLAGGSTKGNFVLATSQEDETVTEALRSLRTSLHFALIDAPNNVVMVTGPTPGLGKTFISVNLSALLALSGKRVVIVDADVRRGYLHRYFAAEPSPGITDFLAGDVDAASIVRPTGVERFDFVSRGTIPPNPAELLLSERFSAFIQQLSGKYDFVLIDSPPVLPVTDAAIVGRLAGSTLLVLKAAEHPLREIEETLKRLSNARVSVRGVVFNQMGSKVGSYGYGNYGYTYYKYDRH